VVPYDSHSVLICGRQPQQRLDMLCGSLTQRIHMGSFGESKRWPRFSGELLKRINHSALILYGAIRLKEVG
jgi:hypothetical protein